MERTPRKKMERKEHGNTSTSQVPHDSIKGTFNAPGTQAVVGAVVWDDASFEELNYGIPLFGPVPEAEQPQEGWHTVNVGKAPRPKH